MPKIEKQSPRPPTKRADAREGWGGRRSEGIKISAYGSGKTGKTRLFATFPKPSLLIGTEDGTKSISTGRKPKAQLKTGTWVYALTLPGGRETGIDFCHLKHSDEIDELVEMAEADPYRSISLDHGSGLEEMLLAEHLGLSGPVNRGHGMAERSDWVIAQTGFKDKVHQLLSLADRLGVDVMVIAHERSFKEEGVSSDIMMPTVGSALTPKVAAWLNGACDYVCQSFVRLKEIWKETEVKDSRGGTRKVKTRVATNEAEYCLRVGRHPVYMTGFRLPPGTYLPDVIVDPSYDKILSVIQGTYKDNGQE